MARIPTVIASEAGREVEEALTYVRSGMAQLTGRDGEGMIEPLELYAHLPGLMDAYLGLEQATASQEVLEKRYEALAQLKAATLTQCEYCIDLGSQVSRLWGLSDQELLALPFYRESPLFTEIEKLVLDYAVAMSRTPVDVSEEVFTGIREHFSDAEIVYLTHVIALENMRGRFNLALGVEAVGFSEGGVCAVPALSPLAGAGRG